MPPPGGLAALEFRTKGQLARLYTAIARHAVLVMAGHLDPPPPSTLTMVAGARSGGWRAQSSPTSPITGTPFRKPAGPTCRLTCTDEIFGKHTPPEWWGSRHRRQWAGHKRPDGPPTKLPPGRSH
jgi:hypothetical protein